MTTIFLDKIKLHKEKSEVHKQAEEQELQNLNLMGIKFNKHS